MQYPPGTAELQLGNFFSLIYSKESLELTVDLFWILITSLLVNTLTIYIPIVIITQVLI